MNRSKATTISIITLLILSLSFTIVSAQLQYEGGKVSPITIGSNGSETITESSLGITYVIQGTPGATGTVTTYLYNANPQPTAEIPDGVVLNSFFVISFDMSDNDFSEAQVVISYSDADVSGLKTPYAIYKYSPTIDSYVQLPTIVDETARTMTITLTSVDDPLFAIGGINAGEETPGLSTTSWIIVAVSIVIIVVIAVFGVYLWRRH